MSTQFIKWTLLCVVSAACATETGIAQVHAGDFVAKFPVPTSAEASDSELPYLQMSADGQKKINDVIITVNEVWNSQKFKDMVSNARYKHYGDNDDRPDSRVFDVITASHPKILTYYSCDLGGDALASTNPATGKTCFDASYLLRSSTADLVDTVSHEFTHTPGGGAYKHWYLKVPGRSRTVPYLVGDLAWDIVNAQLHNEKLEGASRSSFVVEEVDPANLRAFRRKQHSKKKP